MTRPSCHLGNKARSHWRRFLLAGLIALVVMGLGTEDLVAQVRLEQVPPSRTEHREDGLPPESPIDIEFGDLPRTTSFVNDLRPGLGSPFGEEMDGGTKAGIYQTGLHNSTQIDQRGAGHLALVVQKGINNEIRIRQRRSDQTALVRQRTSNHTLNLTQGGGANNKYFADIQTPNGSGRQYQYSVRQMGSNLGLYQIGRTRTPFSVKQTGHDWSIIIRH